MTPTDRNVRDPKALLSGDAGRVGQAGAAPRKQKVLSATKSRAQNGERWLTVSRKPRREASRVQITPREQQIYCLVAKGLPNKTIALSLGISCWTVSSYLRRLFVKFDVNSRAALVACLMEAGVSLSTASRISKR